MSLLVLGAAALGNTLRRRDSDEELAAMAWSDGLTGLANRRRLDHDIATQDLVEEPIAAIMVDVDHFKTVNDRFGHHEGDDILRRIATMLSAHVRYDDVVYRYGGEEFCILLPGATHDDATRVAARIVEAARTIVLPDDTNVTISVGVAHVADAAASTTVESADRALIAAKSAGRDRAVDASTLEFTTIA
jgi:diguanylate cyclase (GGDEF)-like protein